ncbi:MAG: hypothetical protein ACIAXF_09285 [Phycisphaerales bacterium JB063]
MIPNYQSNGTVCHSGVSGCYGERFGHANQGAVRFLRHTSRELFRFFSLTLMALSVAVPCYAVSVPNDPAAEEAVSHMTQSFVEITSLEIISERVVLGADPDPDSDPRFRDRVIYKDTGMVRTQVWLLGDDGSDSAELNQDRSFVHGLDTIFEPYNRLASVLKPEPSSPVGRIGSTYLQLPLIVSRGQLVSAQMGDDGFVEATWVVRKGELAEWYSVVFADSPPYDVSWIGVGSAEGMHSVEYHYADHKEIETRVRYPMRTMQVLDPRGAAIRMELTVQKAMVNIPIPDSDFVIDLVPGTRVIDYTIGAVHHVDDPDQILGQVLNAGVSEALLRDLPPAGHGKGPISVSSEATVSQVEARSSPAPISLAASEAWSSFRWGWLLGGMAFLSLSGFIFFRVYSKSKSHCLSADKACE